jgi:iron complex transport system substrate-binding protein
LKGENQMKKMSQPTIAALQTAALLIIMLLLGLALSGCSATPATNPTSAGGAATTAPAQAPTTAPTAATEASSETRTIIDHLGNEVVLPKEINRIVIGGLTPLPSVYCMVMGSTDKLVGIDPAAQNAAANSIMNKIMPELAKLPTTFLVDNVMNTEELLKLKPDVVFNHSGMPEHHEACLQAGIPSVMFSTSLFKDEDYNTIKTVNAWIDLIGDVLGIESKTDEMVAYGESVEKLVRDGVAGLSEEEKTDVLVLYNYNGNTITAAGQTFAKYWAKTAGANYLTNDMTTSTAQVDMERIYELDPEVIFLSSFSAYAPEDFFNNTLGEGHDWSSIKAVQNKRVYKFPLGTYYWYPPSSDAPLSLLWVAKSLYPERFESLDLDQEVKDYYKKYYGADISDEDVQWIYFPTEESATNW